MKSPGESPDGSPGESPGESPGGSPDGSPGESPDESPGELSPELSYNCGFHTHSKNDMYIMYIFFVPSYVRMSIKFKTTLKKKYSRIFFVLLLKNVYSISDPRGHQVDIL